jgi:hypothetical protein
MRFKADTGLDERGLIGQPTATPPHPNAISAVYADRCRSAGGMPAKS